MMLCAEAPAPGQQRRTRATIHLIKFGDMGSNTCPDGSVDFTESECASLGEVSLPDCSGGCTYGGVNSYTTEATGCFSATGYGKYYFNTIASSSPGSVDYKLCKEPATPAPTPQAGSMSGDPIVSVNGLRVKFELPAGQTTLMWGNDDLEFFAKADVMTPDKQSQWFSDFILVVNGHQAAHIQRNVIKVTSKEMHGTLNTLSLTTVDEAGCSHAVLSPGSYPVGNGTVNIMVKRDGARVGPLPREVVTVKSNSISFSISAERAKKFAPNEEKALKYSHLDIILHKMSRNVKKGIFAEIWGFVPMSSKTARMMKQVTAE